MQEIHYNYKMMEKTIANLNDKPQNKILIITLNRLKNDQILVWVWYLFNIVNKLKFTLLFIVLTVFQIIMNLEQEVASRIE
jgi:hypothetical protein